MHRIFKRSFSVCVRGLSFSTTYRCASLTTGETLYSINNVYSLTWSWTQISGQSEQTMVGAALLIFLSTLTVSDSPLFLSSWRLLSSCWGLVFPVATPLVRKQPMGTGSEDRENEVMMNTHTHTHTPLETRFHCNSHAQELLAFQRG